MFPQERKLEPIILIFALETMQALRSQQSTIHQQTSFTQKGLQHLNSKVLASQLGEGVDQEAAASELSSLQESIHIIAHVAHAVAVNQLDTPQAHIQIPSPLTLSSSQSSSERRVFGVATAASAPLLPEPMAAAQETIGRGDNEATVQLVDSPSMRGSFMGLPDAKPTISTGAVNISSETLDDLSEGSNKNKASDLISPEIAHPSSSTISGGLGQSIPPTAANSIKALTLVPSQANLEVARPANLGPASEETPATRADSPPSRMNPITAPEVQHYSLVRLLPSCKFVMNNSFGSMKYVVQGPLRDFAFTKRCSKNLLLLLYTMYCKNRSPARF